MDQEKDDNDEEMFDVNGVNAASDSKETDTDATDPNKSSANYSSKTTTPPTMEELMSLKRFLQYYTNGIKFFKQIKNCIPTLCELMASNTKTEVIECMKFFVVASKFDMEGSKVC